MTNKNFPKCDLCNQISVQELKFVGSNKLCSTCEKIFKEKIENKNMTRMVQK